MCGPVKKQIEQLKGEWCTYFNGDYNDEIIYCSECGHNLENEDQIDFCPYCHAPMTDKAVEILYYSLKKIYE